MNTHQIQGLATALLTDFGLYTQGWRFDWDNGKRRLGACHYSKKRITMSRYLVANCNDAEIRETLLHEIAHALTPGHHHDGVWRAKLIEMGGTGKRTHSVETVKGRYEVHCANCGVVGNKHHAQGMWKRNVGKPDAFAYYTHRTCGNGRMWLVDTGAVATPDQRLRQAVAASKEADKVIADALKLLACTCGCGGTTKGGRYLPGHDARHLSDVFSRWLKSEFDLDGARELLPTQALQDKLTKRVQAHAEKHYK